jgi:hypothetical protein
MSRTATGFSGEGYEVWVEAPAERIEIRGAALHDHATALLTLDDGRELLVDLTGLREPGNDSDGRAIVTLFLSDPVIAMLGPEEIRARLRILPDIRWCAHWDDKALAEKGDATAKQASLDALDGWRDSEEADFISHLSPDIDPMSVQRYRRETLLHREVKDILEKASSIETPGLELEVTRYIPDEFAGEPDDPTVRKVWLTASRRLKLAEVMLERRLGTIVPDVIATLAGPQIYVMGGTATWVEGDFEADIEDDFIKAWPSKFLIEVTVTHGIDAEKLGRIRELDLPTLEIDICSLRGKVTLEGLRELVVNQTIGKRWVYHPVWRYKRKMLETEIDEHPLNILYQERQAELRRPRLLATPATEWASVYLSAAIAFFDANTRIKKEQRTHVGSMPKPSLLSTDSELWMKISEAAEALDVHSFPGGADTAMLDEVGVIPRLLSIKLNRGVGYAVNTGFQVLNAIMQSGTDTKQWNTLYLMAVKTYGLNAHFTQKQANLYAAWRKTMIESVESGDKTCLRSVRYDSLLSVLFPEMAPRIANGYGVRKDELEVRL